MCVLTVYKNQLEEFWKDVDGEHLAKGLQEAITKTRNQIYYLQRQLLVYQKMVKEYAGASADVQQKIENVFQAMSSIGSVAMLTGM